MMLQNVMSKLVKETISIEMIKAMDFRERWHGILTRETESSEQIIDIW